MRKLLTNWGIALFIATGILASTWYAKYRWDECRDFGHTKLYCVGHVVQ